MFLVSQQLHIQHDDIFENFQPYYANKKTRLARQKWSSIRGPGTKKN